MTDSSNLIPDLGRAISAGTKSGNWAPAHYMDADSPMARAIATHLIADFIVIPRADLPKRAPEAALELLTAAGYTSASHGNPDHVLLGEAIRCLDAWADRVIAEAKRNARRDELTAELITAAYGADGGHSCDYAGVSTALRGAVDRIIELEEAPA